MKRALVVLAGTFFVYGAAAQSQAPPSSSDQTSSQVRNERTNASLASGWTINAELTSPIDAKKAKQGDAVNAKTTEAIKANGKTILPSGTKLLGHLTQVSAKAKGDQQSVLGIAFDKAVLKNGEETPLNVVIQALSTPHGAEQANTSRDMPAMLAGSSPMNSDTPVNSGVPGGVNPQGRSMDTPATTSTNNPGENSTNTLSANGRLTPSSKGVFGLRGASLTTVNGTQGSVISSTEKNLQLDSGTQLLLVTQSTSADAGPKP